MFVLYLCLLNPIHGWCTLYCDNLIYEVYDNVVFRPEDYIADKENEEL